MPQFNNQQKEQILLTLGYANPDSLVNSQLSLEYTQSTIDRCAAILSELNSIDSLIKEARDNSFVRESRNTKLSYANHLIHLRSDATKLLKELAHLLSIDVEYNRYLGHRQYNYW
ncbi:hypothetical protein Nos7524_3200 [Nostoc sp. PCC 7524]|uniref:hypothetical protein n=1 Tax=Nostoc sp. (strain ATCC 29411 / PCC 7524) TaxID=28072 RepID=UPI00029F1739|nr:hypothetical protein [Nostoc sp. PCC 7524]AFY49000.1 hypothetical protein Nos7524_3200 [Nostoc sp. PCC 7524]